MEVTVMPLWAVTLYTEGPRVIHINEEGRNSWVAFTIVQRWAESQGHEVSHGWARRWVGPG